MNKTAIKITIPFSNGIGQYLSYLLSDDNECIGTVKFDPEIRYLEMVKEHDETGAHDEELINVFEKTTDPWEGTSEYFFKNFNILGQSFDVSPYTTQLSEGDEKDYEIVGFHNMIVCINGKKMKSYTLRC